MEQQHQSIVCDTYAEGMKERRYLDGFFDCIFSLFPTLDIIAGTFKLNINQLLQLLLENIYNEDKIDRFVCEIRKLEQAAVFESIRHALITPTISEYARMQNIDQEIQSKALGLVDKLAKMDIMNALMFNSIWEQDIFYIENESKIKFYEVEDIATILGDVLVKSELDPFELKGEMMRNFLLHKFDIPMIYKKKQRRKIELTLTKYYKVHCKRKTL